ncbi:peptidase inhibitor family I36 protein [Cellulomonas sp. C5510]|uniref:peptidase inhibitor family I36 protein n=1 Tax=Cellulomonas sp. C5510 TaxID=2871170 RepID=UPI001C97CD9E|nr:peptidase inhibitor family I36 protein [Cellulomonas sp. C5510]QZN84846.1 peptidase inhibitor family I36 protein [Cellulomonas sp. C5510]
METSRRTRRARFAAVAAVALALTALAPVAQADEDVSVGARSSGQCASGRFCVWSGTNYSGSFWSTASVGLQDTTVPVAGSVWNRMGVDVRMYSGTGGSGSIRCWNNGQQNGAVSVGSASIRTMTATTC